MDLDFVVKMQLIVEHIICVIFAAVVKTGQGCQVNNLEQNIKNLEHFIVQTTARIFSSPL